MSEERYQEEFATTGNKVVAKAKELIRAGNVRRIIVKNEKGRTLLDVPLTAGAVVAVLLPLFVAVGAIGALAARCTIIVEKVKE